LFLKTVVLFFSFSFYIFAGKANQMEAVFKSVYLSGCKKKIPIAFRFVSSESENFGKREQQDE